MPRGSASRSTDATARAQTLTEFLRPVVDAAGFDLEDVTVTPAGRRSVVRVIVDSDSGVDLDDVAAISRTLSERLDAESPGGAAFAGPYVLEVSSPGVDRPLTAERHWRRSLGRLVTTTIDDQPMTARVAAVVDGGVELETDSGRRQVPWSSLGTGRVQVEFTRAGARPGEG